MAILYPDFWRGVNNRLTIQPALRYNTLTLTTVAYSLDLLWKLLALDSPSGDEGAIADWIEDWVAPTFPEAQVERLGDSLVVVKGNMPLVALFAHLDTTGWTLGYEKNLIRIGGPHGKVGDRLRPVGRPERGNTLGRRPDGSWKLCGKTDALPGSGWVYAEPPQRKNAVDGEEIRAPYLDNRAGVWAVLQALIHCPNIAVALTTSEETHGGGAITCARILCEQHGIQQALISDLTWHTKHVRCGKGVAISLRDSSLPRRRYLGEVLALAEASGIPFQREIEASGGSDGGSIDRSGVPMDWVFVGAPEKSPHTARESVRIADLQSMAAMLVHLTNGLS